MNTAVAQATSYNQPRRQYDRTLLLAAAGLLAIGLLMVYSSSITIASRTFHQPFYYLIRQSCFLVVAISLSVATLQLPIQFWQRSSSLCLLASFVFLILVLIPGIGHVVNGSMRWIRFGPVGFQVSEMVKLLMAVYLADYIVRHEDDVRETMVGFLKPLMIWAVLAGLLLLQPDFGATAVILAMFLGVLFLSGVRVWRFAAILAVMIGVLGVLAMTSHYRFVRMTTFLHPWAHQYDSGYQLTQSLIAFGRGGWLGVGLGDSIQKLFYLPEAHTDFVFAVLAEELGLIGELVVIILFALLIWRALAIGRRAYRNHSLFAAFLAYGIGLWLGLQAIINICVTAGLLPTKGLTLPLMSYGGSSLVIDCVAIAVLLRIDWETRRGICYT